MPIRLFQANDQWRNGFLANPFNEREVDGHLEECGIDRGCRQVCHLEFEHRSACRAPTKDDVASLRFTDVFERRPFRLLAMPVSGPESVTRSGRPPPRIAGQARVEVNVPAVGDSLALPAPRSNEWDNAPRRDHMACRSTEEFFPLASVDRLRFNEDRRCRLDRRLSDSRGAIPYFLS